MIPIHEAALALFGGVRHFAVQMDIGPLGSCKDNLPDFILRLAGA